MRLLSPRLDSMAAGSLTIPFATAAQILEAASRAGLDREKACTAAGIDPDQAARGSGAVLLQALWRLWEVVMLRLRDPAFPIAVAELHRLDRYGALTFLAMTSRDVEEAMGNVARFWRLWTSASSWELERRSTSGHLVFAHFVGDCALGQRCDQEFTLAEMTQAIRQVIGNAQWAPLEVRFRHERPRSIARHETFFGAPLVFGAARVELKLRESDLRLTPLRADRMLGEFFERHAEELVRKMGDLPADILRIKAAIVDELRGSVPRLSAVASRLAVGGRTLRRQLQRQGLSFRALVDLTRGEMAREYLEQSRLSIAEIAYLLGFSESSAFHRAFRRWTGEAPLRYRERVFPRER